MKSMINWRSSEPYLILILLLFAGLHITQISQPPNGFHQWRESDTAAIGLNYYQENTPFWFPKVMQREDKTGITGMEFPIYNYTFSLLWEILGPRHLYARLLSLLMGMLGLTFFYRLVKQIEDGWTALISTAILGASPVYFFYSAKIMPDSTMIGCLLIGVFNFYVWIKHRERRHFIWATLFLSLAALIKPTALFIGVPMIYLLYMQNGTTWIKDKLIWLMVAIILGSTILWYIYAKWLITHYGIYSFYLGENWLEMARSSWSSPRFMQHLFTEWPKFRFLTVYTFYLFLIGSVICLLESRGRLFLCWLAGAYLGFVLMPLGITGSHDYYALVMIPAFAAIAGIGACQFLKKNWITRVVAIIFLCLAPGTAKSEIEWRYGPTFNLEELRTLADEYIPREERVVVEDRTPIEKLYQMNRFGWAIRHTLTYQSIRDRRKLGARYLVTDSSINLYDSSIIKLVDSHLFSYRNFHAYHLKQEEPSEK